MSEQLSFFGPCQEPHLADLKHQVEADLEAGAACPCCGQLCKLYTRKLNSQMAVFLIRLVKLAESRPTQPYFGSREITGTADTTAHKASSDGTYLRLWGLIEQAPADDDGNRARLWRPTPFGFAFARGDLSVPRYAFVFDNEARRFSMDDHSDIRQALSAPFDYDELWGETG